MFEAVLGESYSPDKKEEWGKKISVPMRVGVGIWSALESALVAWSIYGGIRGIIYKTFDPEVNVVSWATKAKSPELPLPKPDLNSGRYVMLGNKNKINYFLSGLIQRGAGEKYNNAIEGTIHASQLKWPPGWQKIKGIIGQRVIQ